MKRVAVLRGQVRRDKFFFPCRINGHRISHVVLDTGAFDFVLSERIAKRLHLIRDKAVAVRGVSGTARAWTSHCNLTVGKQKFNQIPCVVMQDLPYEALFGLRFFIDHGYQLLLDPKVGTLSFLR